MAYCWISIHVHGVWLQRGRCHRLPHHRFPARAPARHHHQQLCALQRAVSRSYDMATFRRFRADLKAFGVDLAAETTVLLPLRRSPNPSFASATGNIGQKIRQARRAKGITQKELSAALHVAETSLRLWELDKAVPHYKAWRRLKAYFDW